MPDRYRKKPVVIEAIRYMPGETCEQISEWLGDEHHPDDCFEGAEYAIETLEGVMWAQPGDWIIKGVKGEFYPCKPEIFAATYEVVTDAPK